MIQDFKWLIIAILCASFVVLGIVWIASYNTSWDKHRQYPYSITTKNRSCHWNKCVSVISNSGGYLLIRITDLKGNIIRVSSIRGW